MKIFRYLQNGSVKQGIAVDGKNFDVSDFGEDFNEVFFEIDGMNRLTSFVKENEPKEINGDIQFAAPFARPSKILCIGLNYAEHAKETGATPPAEPVIFMKSTTALAGPNDNIII